VSYGSCTLVVLAAANSYLVPSAGTYLPSLRIYWSITLTVSTGFQPFMEYAGSYALYNYRLNDPSKPLTYGNLSLIRAFEHGLDPKSSEAGFVLVHINMAKESGGLVTGALDVLGGCSQNDRSMLNTGLDEMLTALQKINGVMEEMWKKSKPSDYNSFRTYCTLPPASLPCSEPVD